MNLLAFQSLFVQPIPITGFGRLGMLLPLALSISIIYKTIRCDHISQIPAPARLCPQPVFKGLIGVSFGFVSPLA
jgi:hypothetical protein